MRALLSLRRFSEAFRYRIPKPMSVNFVLATNMFDMPASLFAGNLEFFDNERATPVPRWIIEPAGSTKT